MYQSKHKFSIVEPALLIVEPKLGKIEHECDKCNGIKSEIDSINKRAFLISVKSERVDPSD